MCIFGCLSAFESSSATIVFPPHCSPALVGTRTRSYFLVHLHDYRDGGDEEEDDCEDLVEEEEEVDGADVDTDVGDHKCFRELLRGSS